MAELLSFINSIDRYKIKDMLDKKICINIPDISTFEMVQKKIKELYPDVNLLPESFYDEEEDICISIRTGKYNNMMIGYCSHKWYTFSNYIIIDKEDILWSY